MKLSPDRFAIERLENGGMLLDLETGQLFQTNASATIVWEEALAGNAADVIAANLVARHGISQKLAEADVVAALEGMDAAKRPSVESELRYERSTNGYHLFYRGQPAVEVVLSGKALRLVGQLQPHPEEISVLLRAIAPRLVALLGIPVLHASAVVSAQGQTLAFLGESGAGKTTTARAFAQAGWRVIAEDKLVLRIQDDGPRAVTEGEPMIRRWIANTRDRLQRFTTGDWCSIEPLADIATGPAESLTDLFLLLPRPEVNSDMILKPLAQNEAACEIFRAAFYGSATNLDWRRQLSAAAKVARSVRAAQAVMPVGLDSLKAAARCYTDRIAS